MTENDHEKYMNRCLALAKKASGRVSPNPMVGAVLVHEGIVIGEGYHERFGGGHAEVNCIASVTPQMQQYITRATLYVSLEPCAHFGKTPPCADLIVDRRIPHVVIGCSDPFPLVRGKGISKLRDAGVRVETGILEQECIDLNRRFFLFLAQRRPYVILKWAQTGDAKIGYHGGNRLLISNELTNRLVHRWRNEEDAVMVGTNTAAYDDPLLTNRLWTGRNPVRIVLDMELRLPPTLRIFDGNVRTIVFNRKIHAEKDNITFYQLTNSGSTIHQVLNGLRAMNIQSVMIEGGSMLTQSFIDEGLWDEARVITNPAMILNEGVAAPLLTGHQPVHAEELGGDLIRYYRRH